VPRKPRENEPNGIYHVYARGNNRERIFHDDRDRRLYLTKLEEAASRWWWRGMSYCLMDNHLHLLLQTPDPNLSEGMRFLQGGYAQAFNLRHGRTGHVFQGRYGAVRMQSDAQVCAAAAYVARNPVEAGMCKTPDGWAWSSFRGASNGKSPAWIDSVRLFEFFDPRQEIGRRRYIEMCSSGPYDPLR
jgi:REP element-mobilizing transposase RayT